MHHTRPARVITALNRSVSCVLPCNYVARGAMAASPHAACRIARRSHSSLPRDASAPSEPLGNQSTTHFGFKTIPEEVKESLVGKVFGSVASSYDVMNDVMSAGIHRIWKDYYIQRLNPDRTTKLLDVAGGTGDIAFRFLDRVKSTQGTLGDCHVTVLDINPAMLEVGKKKARDMGLEGSPHMDWKEGNAENLAEIPSNSMDAYTIAFGIRNCTHVDRVIKEAYRVLKPGGRFMVLEFSSVENPLLKKIYDLYSFEIIPVMGHVIAGDRDSYQYLVESIRKFPPQPVFAQMIRDAGFKVVGKGWEDLTFGIAAIHEGIKL